MSTVGMVLIFLGIVGLVITIGGTTSFLLWALIYTLWQEREYGAIIIIVMGISAIFCIIGLGLIGVI